MKAPKIKVPGTTVLLSISAVLTLVALALMVWSVLQPTPLPVMLAMSVAQGIGTLAFAIYLYVVFVDVVRKRRVARESAPPPFGAPKEPPR